MCSQDAAVIFALDPVYGAAFAWLLRGEELGTNGYGGIALVLVAVALSYSQGPEQALVTPEERERLASEWSLLSPASPESEGADSADGH